MSEFGLSLSNPIQRGVLRRNAEQRDSASFYEIELANNTGDFKVNR